MADSAFAFSADTHLDKHNWARRPELFGDSQTSFQYIIDVCIEKHIPLVLGGDIFDKNNPDPGVVKFFVEQCERLHQACGENVYFIQGDHDKRMSPWCSLSPYALWVDQQTFYIGNLSFYGLDFYPRSQIVAKLKAVPDVDFLVTHLAWSDIQNLGATNADVSSLLASCDILTGDWHTHKIYEFKNGNDQLISAYSPGSTNMRAWGEHPIKSFYIFDTDGNPTSHEIVTRDFETFVIQNEKELEYFLGMEMINFFAESEMAAKKRPDNLCKPAFRIRYDGSIPRIYERLQMGIKDRAHVFYEPFAEEALEVDIKAILRRETSFDEVVAEFSKDDRQQQNAAIRLLSTNELESEFKQLEAEYVN